jgi:hypothetical protein
MKEIKKLKLKKNYIIMRIDKKSNIVREPLAKNRAPF